MQDVLLLVVVAATFVFGWFVMGKVDCFLEADRHAQELQLASGGNILRLGFCDPTAADSMTDVLEQYSRLCPDTSVRIFCGSEGKLLKGLSGGKLDVIFLPINTEIPAHMHYNSKGVSLNYMPVVMKYSGLLIEPIADGRIIQNALWNGETASAYANCFMKCLKEK